MAFASFQTQPPQKTEGCFAVDEAAVHLAGEADLLVSVAPVPSFPSSPAKKEKGKQRKEKEINCYS